MEFLLDSGFCVCTVQVTDGSISSETHTQELLITSRLKQDQILDSGLQGLDFADFSVLKTCWG